jgi:predicted Rossmann fold nucleotide-binding protein DprA/Smf involved in DNA uptake
MKIDITEINSSHFRLPSNQKNSFFSPVSERTWAIGNLEILDRPLLGFFCSARCPGNVIIETYDMVLALREAGVPVISGFHSPMEKECLNLLLRGRQPVVICPARSILRMRIPAAWQQPLAQRRLLIISPFEANQRRVTAALAEQRNRFVAALASEVLVAYAGPGTKTVQLCDALLASGTGVRVVDIPDHARLIKNGAVPLQPGQPGAIIRQLARE